MPVTAKLKPVKTEDGKWRVSIPAAYSSTGKRRRVFFPSEAKAEAEVRRIKARINKHGSESTRFTARESSNARSTINKVNCHCLSGEKELTLNAAVSLLLRPHRKGRGFKYLLGSFPLVSQGEKEPI